MQSFFEAPKDVIGLLGGKLTDYSIILDILHAAKQFPETYNKLSNSINAIITNSSNKYKVTLEVLATFPNLEIVEIQFIGNVTDLLNFANLPKLTTFNFKFNWSYDEQIEDIKRFINAYCTGSFTKDGITYINNRDLKNVNFQIYNANEAGGGALLLLVGKQLFFTSPYQNMYKLFNQFADINGIWGFTYYKPPREFVKHTFVTSTDLQYKIYDAPNFPRYKYHFTSLSSESQIVNFCYSFWGKLLGYSYPNVIQFDLPIVLRSLEVLDTAIFNIFPNVKEFMAFPIFTVDKPIIGYNGRTIKFYKPPLNNLTQEDLPELPTHKTMYDAMLAENNLQNK